MTRTGRRMKVAMPPHRKRHLGHSGPESERSGSPPSGAESPSDTLQTFFPTGRKKAETGEKNPSPVKVNGWVTLKSGHSATASDQRPPPQTGR